MSQRNPEDLRGAPERAPEEYRRAEYNEYRAELPYGPAWPGGFAVGAGALLLFFGAFLVFVIFFLASPAGPYTPIVGALFLLVTVVAFSVYMWSGLGRYVGASRAAEDTGREGRRGR